MVTTLKKSKLVPKQTRQSPRMKVPQSEAETSSRSAPLVPAYINPRDPGAPIIELAKQAKYIVPLPSMPEEVWEQGNLLGKIDQLKFQDYNLQDPQKFPQFQADQYLVVREELVTKRQRLALQPWIEVLEPSGLLNFLRIPHFGQSVEVTIVVKMLLSCMHEGFLWLDRKVDLNVHLIHRITGLSKRGVDPAKHFVGKELDRQTTERMKRLYNL